MVRTDASIALHSLSPAPFSCLLSGELVKELQKDDTHTAGWEVTARSPTSPHPQHTAKGLRALSTVRGGRRERPEREPQQVKPMPRAHPSLSSGLTLAARTPHPGAKMLTGLEVCGRTHFLGSAQGRSRRVGGARRRIRLMRIRCAHYLASCWGSPFLRREVPGTPIFPVSPRDAKR